MVEIYHFTKREDDTMQKLTNQSLEAAFSYFSLEPEFNLFFIGDLEQCGMEGEDVTCFTDDDWKPGMDFPYFILDYRGNVLVYSQNLQYDAKKVAEFLNEMQPENINGKDEIVRPLLAHMENRIVKPTHLARLGQIWEQQKKEHQALMGRVRKLTEKDIPAAYELYLTIDEFAYTYRRKGREECFEDIRRGIRPGMGRMYGIYEGDQLVSVAQTTAENQMSAMVVGVATRPESRGNGYAKATVLKLCEECLADGKSFLCLFFDNPSAGRIYHSIGFEDMGIYTMVRKGPEA